MLLFGFADKLQIKLHLDFNQASLGAAPHMRASHHPLLLERVSQRNLWPYEGIPHNIRIMFTNSAHMCSWLSTSRKSKVHFQIVQILSSLGFSFSCSPSFTKSLVVVMSNTSMKSSIRHLWSNESIMSPWLWWSSRLSSMPLSNCWCTCSRTVHGKSCACSLLRMSWPQSFEIGILVEVLSVNSWGKPLLNI